MAQAPSLLVGVDVALYFYDGNLKLVKRIYQKTKELHEGDKFSIVGYHGGEQNMAMISLERTKEAQGVTSSMSQRHHFSLLHAEINKTTS